MSTSNRRVWEGNNASQRQNLATSPPPSLPKSPQWKHEASRLREERRDVLADPVRRPEDTVAERETVPIAHGQPTIRPGRIRPLRLKRFLKLLKDNFECIVERGKGSEITVYRRGGRKAVLNGHKLNPSVSTITVKKVLRRVGIGHGEWLAAVG
jgi:hypothetical protein